MKAAILHGKEDVRIEDVNPRPLQEGEVRLGIEAALTCGTDLKVYRRGYHARMIVPPAAFGHELAGVITETGPGANDRRLGDRVVVANSAPCGNCFHCQNNQENLCDDLLFLNGAYAESIVVPERLVRRNLLALKPETAFRDAALTEPLACVVQGVADLDLRPGRRVLVIGSGPIGLLFVAVARHLGCRVAVVGRGANRLAAARRLGADAVVEANVAAGAPGAAPAGLEGGFDAVIEAVGKPETWEAALAWVRKGGAVNFFGGCQAGTSVALDTARMHYSSLTLRASFHHTPATIRRALELIEQGVVRADEFVDGECPLTRLPDLFRSMAAGNRAVKTLIRVRE